MITRDNYEIYFIDYLDGNLSTALEEELMAFLSLHPDLKEELDQLKSEEPLSLHNVEEYGFKNALKKEHIVNEENEDDYFVGLLEEDLNEEEQKYVTLYLKENPSKEAKKEMFQKTKLTPDFTKQFLRKGKLKKTARIVLLYRSAAAVAIAASILFFVFRPSTVETGYYIKRNDFMSAFNVRPISMPDLALNSLNVPLNTEDSSVKEKNHTTTKPYDPKNKALLSTPNSIADASAYEVNDTVVLEESNLLANIALKEPTYKLDVPNGYIHENPIVPDAKGKEYDYTLAEFVKYKVLPNTSLYKKIKGDENLEEEKKRPLIAFIQKSTKGFIEIKKGEELDDLMSFEVQIGNKITISKEKRK